MNRLIPGSMIRRDMHRDESDDMLYALCTQPDELFLCTAYGEKHMYRNSRGEEFSGPYKSLMTLSQAHARLSNMALDESESEVDILLPGWSEWIAVEEVSGLVHLQCVYRIRVEHMLFRSPTTVGAVVQSIQQRFDIDREFDIKSRPDNEIFKLCRDKYGNAISLSDLGGFPRMFTVHEEFNLKKGKDYVFQPSPRRRITTLESIKKRRSRKYDDDEDSDDDVPTKRSKKQQKKKPPPPIYRDDLEEEEAIEEDYIPPAKSRSLIKTAFKSGEIQPFVEEEGDGVVVRVGFSMINKSVPEAQTFFQDLFTAAALEKLDKLAKQQKNRAYARKR